MVKSCKNITWELNHSIIRDSYVKLIQTLKRKPIYDEVVTDSGLSRNTIQKHLQLLKFDPSVHKLRVLTDDVILSIHETATKGSTTAQKLWMQIIEGWSEKTVLEHESNVNINDVRKRLIDRLIGKKDLGDKK